MFTFQDYELSAGEASDLIAALGGASQQRAGYREPLGVAVDVLKRCDCQHAIAVICSVFI